MYHEPKLLQPGYYDTIEEIPNMCKVRFPDEKEYKEMSPEDVCALDEQGWYTIMHSVNWGSCDHWTSEKPSKWVRERFNHIIQYTSRGKTIGYNRADFYITLTRQSDYWKSEVWNS